MVHERIDERSIGMVYRRMAYESDLLGDDEQIIVLIADVKRNRLASSNDDVDDILYHDDLANDLAG